MILWCWSAAKRRRGIRKLIRSRETANRHQSVDEAMVPIAPFRRDHGDAVSCCAHRQRSRQENDHAGCGSLNKRGDGCWRFAHAIADEEAVSGR